MYDEELMEEVLEKSPEKQRRERFGSSYVARLSYRGVSPLPLGSNGVEGAVDMHCHAMPGQQNPLAVAKKASLGGAGAVLFKGMSGVPTGAAAARQVAEELAPWCEEHDVAPTPVFAGYTLGQVNFLSPSPSDTDLREAPAKARAQLEDGTAAVWLPVFSHANTITKVATRSYEPGHQANALPPRERPMHAPLSMAEAKRAGHYLLDDNGKLLPEIVEIIKMVADHDAVLSFGHVSRQEQWMVTEELKKHGHVKAFIDHPFSPFIDLTRDEMKQFAEAGVKLNFTWDELSPLLGVDPLDMFGAIAEIGAEHCMLSSDAGEPLFPDSVECLRLMRAYAGAFGIEKDDVTKITSTNAAKLLGVKIESQNGNGAHTAATATTA